jgi:hypothetical protein
MKVGTAGPHDAETAGYEILAEPHCRRLATLDLCRRRPI